jgi:glutathione S-transferase
MGIRLHALALSPRGFKVLFAANQIGIDYEFVPIDFNAGDHRTPAFTRLNPNQRMPVLEHDGYSLWESNAIIQYLAALKPESGYLPADLKARMSAVKWQFWDSSHWDAACAIFMFENVVKKFFNLGDPNSAELKRGEDMMARLCPVLDDQLQNTRYVAGERITVADLSLAPSLCHTEMAQIPVGNYKNIQRWMAEIRALPAWEKAIALQKS